MGDVSRRGCYLPTQWGAIVHGGEEEISSKKKAQGPKSYLFLVSYWGSSPLASAEKKEPQDGRKILGGTREGKGGERGPPGNWRKSLRGSVFLDDRGRGLLFKEILLKGGGDGRKEMKKQDLEIDWPRRAWREKRRSVPS